MPMRGLGSLNREPPPPPAPSYTRQRGYAKPKPKGHQRKPISAGTGIKRNYGGGGGGGGTGGKVGGVKKPSVSSSKPSKTPTKTAVSKPPAIAPGPVKPIVPTLDQYLGGDTTYQDQLRQFDRTLGDFIANLGVRKTRLTADYGENKRDMEQQRTKDLEAIKNDFASRGLLSSGLLVDESGKYEKSYAQQLADFERQFTQSQGDLTLEDTQFRREQELAKEAARQDAARRRAEKYGI